MIFRGGGGGSGPPVPTLYLPMWTTYGFGSRWICWVPKLKTKGPKGPEALTWYWATMYIYINGIECITSDIWPSHKEGQGQPRINICSILVGPTLPILHTKSKAHQPSGSYEEDFYSFYHIWARCPSWSCDQNNLNKFWLTYHKKSSYEIKDWLAWWFLRKLYNVLTY